MNYGSKLTFLVSYIYLFPVFLYAQGNGGSTAPGSDSITFTTILPFIGGDPNTGTWNIDSLGELVNDLFLLALVTGALLAVVKLVIAGATYMLGDVVTQKQTAIASIKGAVLGLLLILSTWLILTQINPDITSSNGINLSTIVVEDDEDRDEQIIEEMCEGEFSCGAQTCDDTETECKEICEGYFEDTFGYDNTHYNKETKTCHYVISDEINDYPEGTIEDTCPEISGQQACSNDSCVNDNENYYSFMYKSIYSGGKSGITNYYYFCTPI